MLLFCRNAYLKILCIYSFENLFYNNILHNLFSFYYEIQIKITVQITIKMKIRFLGNFCNSERGFLFPPVNMVL